LCWLCELDSILCLQVQHAFAPSEAAMPGATEISSSDGPQADVSANNAQAEASAGRAKADGKDKMSKDEDGVPSFGQWGSAFRPAVVLAALPAPEGTQAPESMQGTARQAGGKFYERAAIGEEGQSHDWAAQGEACIDPRRNLQTMASTSLVADCITERTCRCIQSITRTKQEGQW